MSPFGEKMPFCQKLLAMIAPSPMRVAGWMLSRRMRAMKIRETKGVRKIRLEMEAVLWLVWRAFCQRVKVKPISKMPTSAGRGSMILPG